MVSADVPEALLELFARDVQSQFHAYSRPCRAARVGAAMNKIVIEQHCGARRCWQCLQRLIQVGLTKIRLKESFADINASERILAKMRTWNKCKPGCALFEKNWNPNL